MTYAYFRLIDSSEKMQLLFFNTYNICILDISLGCSKECLIETVRLSTQYNSIIIVWLRNKKKKNQLYALLSAGLLLLHFNSFFDPSPTK